MCNTRENSQSLLLWKGIVNFKDFFFILKAVVIIPGLSQVSWSVTLHFDKSGFAVKHLLLSSFSLANKYSL